LLDRHSCKDKAEPFHTATLVTEYRFADVHPKSSALTSILIEARL
jgi:hypothetical protein